MNTSSPFFMFQSLLAQTVARLQPPPWLADEARHRLVLLLNHVLEREPQARIRLARLKGSVVHLRWGRLELRWVITAAGLLDLADGQGPAPDLVLSLDGQTPVQVARCLLEAQRPPVQVEGDVLLAAEVAWLAENLRWDLEEDLARLLGDVPAHALADATRRLLQALRSFVARPADPAAAGGQGVGAGA